MRPFTCQAACEAKWLRHGASTHEDPLGGCDAPRVAQALASGESYSHLAPPPPNETQARALSALWEALDEAFVVR